MLKKKHKEKIISNINKNFKDIPVTKETLTPYLRLMKIYNGNTHLVDSMNLIEMPEVLSPLLDLFELDVVVAFILQIHQENKLLGE